MPSQKSTETKIAALEGPEWNSSDEEDEADYDMMEDMAGLDTSAAAAASPSTAPKSKTSSLRKNDAIKAKQTESSVIYIGHLPSAFGEIELKTFLSQFGDVEDVRVSRSLKTGKPRGYAFVKFLDAEVAAIVMDAMAGYLVDKRRLACQLVPVDKHKGLFFNTNARIKKRQHQRVSQLQKAQEKLNKPDKLAEISTRLIAREKSKRDRLQKLGIDYDFPGYEANTRDFQKEKGALKVGTEQTKKSDKPQPVAVPEESKTEEEKVTPNKKHKNKTKGGEKDESVDDTEEPAAPTVATPQSKKKQKKAKKAETTPARSDTPKVDDTADSTTAVVSTPLSKKKQKKSKKANISSAKAVAAETDDASEPATAAVATPQSKKHKKAEKAETTPVTSKATVADEATEPAAAIATPSSKKKQKKAKKAKITPAKSNDAEGSEETKSEDEVATSSKKRKKSKEDKTGESTNDTIETAAAPAVTTPSSSKKQKKSKPAETTPSKSKVTKAQTEVKKTKKSNKKRRKSSA